MATIIKTEYGWQAQVARRVNGKDFRKAKTLRTKREAQVWARETEVDIVKGTDSEDTLLQLFRRYQHERSRYKKGGHWEIIRLERFAKDDANGMPLGEYTIANITLPDLVAWRDLRLTIVQPASVRREMNLLKHVFVTATTEWGLLRVNPMAGIKLPSGGKRRNRRVHTDEIEALTKAFDLDSEQWSTDKQITGAAFLFAIETAMRAGEILNIKNLHVDGQVVFLPETKNDHEREVPLTYRAKQILEKARGDRVKPEEHPFALDADARDSRFRAAIRSCEISELQFRDSRHEAVTRLSKHLEILDLARVTGHRNLNELLTYYEASGADLAKRLNSSISNEEIR